jgi:AcrR family transcriptional regulator
MPRRAGPGLDRSTVVQAAAELVDSIGVDQLTLAQLAEHLGIRTPSLYNHIAGQSGLRRELTLWCVKELLGRLHRATVGKAGDEALVALAHMYRAYAREHPGRYTCTQLPAGPTDSELQEAQQEVVEVALAVMRPYGLTGEDAVHAVRVLRSAMHGFVSLELMGGFGLPLNLDESFRRLIQMFIDGLRHWPRHVPS